MNNSSDIKDSILSSEVTEQASTGLVREGFVFTGLSILGKVGGFLREWLVAFFFGAGLVSDSYRIAADLVRSMFSIFSGNTVETSLVPLLTRWRIRGVFHSRALVLRVVAWSTILLALVIAAGMSFFASAIAHLQAPKFTGEEHQMVTLMIRWISPAVPLFVACSAVSYLLFRVKRFRTVALLPLMMNLGQIASVTLTGLGWLPIFWLPLMFSVGLIATLTLLVMDARAWWPRERARLTWKRMKVAFGEFIAQFWPLLLLALLTQSRVFIDKRIVSHLEVGAIAALYFARFIVETPLNTFGQALLRLILPHFSELVQLNASKDLARQYLALVDTTLWLMLPIIVLLAGAARPIITLVYGYGAFGKDAIELTSLALIGSSPVLWTALFNPLTNRIFMAQGRNRILLPYGIAGSLLNIALAYTLVHFWGIAGVSLAAGISQLVLTLVLIPLLKLPVTLPAYSRILLWWSWGIAMYVLLRWLPLPAKGIPAILSVGGVVLAGWLAASFLLPRGRENLARAMRVLKRVRSNR